VPSVDAIVIGAGIFGVSAAIALSESGRSCIILDSHKEILSGASAKNQNRLHTGLHYPRDSETAMQSSQGVERFLSKYSSAINGSFANYYYIAERGSKTSAFEFESLAEFIGVELSPLRDSEIGSSGIDRSLVQRGWIVDERVIDIGILRNLMLAQMEVCGIHFFGESEITGLTFDPEYERWTATARNGVIFEATNIVLCTYGIPIEHASPPLKMEARLFQATVIPVVNLSRKSFGVTVLDGDFITILPRGFSNQMLLYGPTPSVAFESPSLFEVQEFMRSGHADISSSRAAVLDRTRTYFPNLSFQDNHESLVTIRALPINSGSTDQRRSYVKRSGVNIFQIISGKVDHAPAVSDQLIKILDMELISPEKLPKC